MELGSGEGERERIQSDLHRGEELGASLHGKGEGWEGEEEGVPLFSVGWGGEGAAIVESDSTEIVVVGPGRESGEMRQVFLGGGLGVFFILLSLPPSLSPSLPPYPPCLLGLVSLACGEGGSFTELSRH